MIEIEDIKVSSKFRNERGSINEVIFVGTHKVTCKSFPSSKDADLKGKFQIGSYEGVDAAQLWVDEFNTYGYIKVGG